jgi:predicted metal-dependent peptidase
MSKLSFKLNDKTIYLLVNKVEPFFAYLLSAISVKIGNYSFAYAACTNNTIMYNKSYIDRVEADSSKLSEFITLTLHEIYHIYFNHSYRFGLHNKGLYKQYSDKAYFLKEIINLVEDAVINQSLKEAGYTFGELGGVFLSTLLEPNHPRINDNNWTEEQLLAYVLANSKFNSGSDNNQQQDNNSNSNNNQQQDNNSNSSSSSNSNSITLPSGLTIKLEEIDLDVLDGDSTNNEEQQETLKDLAKRAANVIRNDKKKQHGKLSNKLIPSDVDSIQSSDLRWEDRLKQIASNSLSDKIITNYNVVREEEFYGYEMGLSPFNRCAINHPYIRLPEPDTIAVFVDLSGSIYGSIDCLNHFLDQINSISKVVGNLLLVTFDEGITGTHLFNMSELDRPLIDVLLEHKDKYLVGGGGTDVIPLFKQFINKGFEQIDINNVCLIVVLTDLYLERVPQELEPFNNKGSIQVIWTVLEKEYYESNIPLFGELLVIDN